MSAILRRSIVTVYSDDIAAVNQIKAAAAAKLSQASPPIPNPAIRPLRAADLNSAYSDIFNGFSVAAGP
ncbi:MAG: hypothetical protein QW334_04280, partial [Thermofilum sp.]